MQLEYRVEALQPTFAEATEQLNHWGFNGYDIVDVTGNRVILERLIEGYPQPFPWRAVLITAV
jgi:hypothetical protein